MHRKSDSIAASAIAGIRWNTLGGIGASVCSMVTGIVLARLLGPRPFGQIIIASTIYGFLNLFVDGGFGQALIQKSALTSEEVRKTFTCQVGIGLAITAVVFALARPIALLFHDAGAVPVVRAMSFMIAIQSTGLVSAALLRRAMRFRVVQYAFLASYALGFLGIGIPMAMRGAGVWSLVTAYLVQCSFNAAFLFAAERHSMVPLFAWPDRSITGFGSTIIANNLVNWGHSNLDNMAASHLGPVALGEYGRGCNFAYQPVNTVSNAMQSVLLSSTAKVRDKRWLMRDVTLAVMAIVLGLLGAAYAVFAATAGTTIVGLYGAKWAGVIPLMVPFALAMPFYGVHSLLGPILCGLGRPELEFWPQAISCIVGGVAFFSAVHFSLSALAWTLCFVILLRFAAIAAFTFRQLGIAWSEAGAILAGRVAISAAFGAAAWCADSVLRFLAAPPTLRLACIAVTSCALLAAMLWFASELLFGRQAVQFLRNYASHLPQAYVRRLDRSTAAQSAAAVSGD